MPAFQPDKLTVKAAEALQRAQRLARDHGQQRLTPMHLLHALLDDPQGIPSRILEKVSIDRETIARMKIKTDWIRNPRPGP
jgi:ATP-dependent Clp protease ATP-binding subunit ClpB